MVVTSPAVKKIQSKTKALVATRLYVAFSDAQ